jgi:hypothetical protein
VAIPLAFRSLQAASLEGWSGDRSSPDFQAVRRAVADTIEGLPPIKGLRQLGRAARFLFKFRRSIALTMKRFGPQVLLAMVAILGVAWAVLRYQEQQRWGRYVARLNAEPGLIVLTDTRRDGEFHLTGLRDPLAKNDPQALAAQMGIPPNTFSSWWAAYMSLEASFVLERANILLRPPEGVSLTFSSATGVLAADGEAPESWIVDSERLGPAVAGVRRFVYNGAPHDVRLKRPSMALSEQ